MTSGRTQFSWSPELDAKLAVLWNAGLSASEISSHIDKTRNAVLGRARRIDLPMRRAAMTGANAGTLRRAPLVPTKHRPKKPPAPHARPLPKHRRPLQVPLSEEERANAWKAVPGSQPVSLLDLRADSCRWPLGESPFVFCGLPATGGSYCAHHANLSSGRGSSYERAAVKMAIDANKAEWAASEEAERKRWEKAA